jgi:hypothetical protein
VPTFLASLSSDALAHPVQDLAGLDLPLHQLYEGIMERILCVLDAGADECACLAVQRLDLGLGQVSTSLGLLRTWDSDLIHGGR